MVIEKHLNIVYVAQSEETRWKTWHRQGQMPQIVFVFEDRIAGIWSRSWMTELRFAELLAFVSDFLHINFIEGIYWCW
jgi:hypothetical protein